MVLVKYVDGHWGCIRNEDVAKLRDIILEVKPITQHGRKRKLT